MWSLARLVTEMPFRLFYSAARPVVRGFDTESSRHGMAATIVLALLLAATTASAESAGEYVIGPPDVLAITVWNQLDLSGKYTVEPDGTLIFPLVGRVTAGGLTLRAFETDLRDQLADGFFKRPRVTVAVDAYRSQRIFIIGQVRQPGTFALTGEMSLIEALARAGSTAMSAADEVVIVHAQDAQGPVMPGEDPSVEVVRVNLKALQSGAVGQNIALRDGDTIYVPLAETIYVFGEVKSQGSYPIRSNMTVLQALSLAGGVSERGATNRIKIVRIVDGEETEFKVKLNSQVQSGDTIIVPKRFF